MTAIWFLAVVVQPPNHYMAVVCSTVCNAATFLMEAIIWQLRHGRFDIDLKVGMMPGPPMNVEKQEKEWPQ